MNTTIKRMFGRKQIFTSAKEINIDNVLTEVVTKGLTKHLSNRSEIEYLYNYYKGDQPVLYRSKDIRADICNQVVENRAQEIVSFKVGYLTGSPIQYISAKENDDVSEAINTLNSMMRTEGKANKDKSLVEWDMICGTAYRLVLPDSEYDEDTEEAPFEIFTLDPRNTYVIYSNGVDHRPLAGVYYVVDEDNNSIKHFSVYTPTEYFELEDMKIVKRERHILGRIPIIEYPANNARMGAFEPVLPLLDAINDIDSNRVDGIEQFIQSLIILYNCQLPEGEDATSLQAKGLIELKSVGENKADIKILSEQLNQGETQTLKDDMYRTVLSIVGMPIQGSGKSDSSNNGAVILKNGWQGAEARAKDSELMFKESEQEFLKQVLRICAEFNLIDIKVADIDTHFTRRNYEDILSKTQVLTQMLASDKIAPKLAFTACGLFIDAEEAYRESLKYIEEKQQRAAEMAQQFSANDEEDDSNVNEDEVDDENEESATN